MSREYCYQCYRPRVACLCPGIRHIDNQPGIIILQHRDEVRHPRGSAIIADLCLRNCVRYVGENFSGQRQLNDIIESNPERVFLLFPKKEALSFSAFLRARGDAQCDTSACWFVFIDASWRKARKIWHLSRNLHGLPTIKLDTADASNYRIRKEPEPGLLSTLESIVHVLSRLESDAEKYRPLLKIFSDMIDRQIESMGDAVYRKNYRAEDDLPESKS